jgi:hypothetical protein
LERKWIFLAAALSLAEPQKACAWTSFLWIDALSLSTGTDLEPKKIKDRRPQAEVEKG